MTIREIEALSGMDRANVRFYEREGLITPARSDNGYRDYSQNDLDVLLRVKLLRSLHISLDEIRALKGGGRDLADTLSQQLKKLELEQRESAYAIEVCRALQADKATFSSLNAKRYLDGIDRTVRETGGSYFVVQGDALPQVFHPWRRYLARALDISLYSVLWSIFLAAVFHVNILSQSQLSIFLGSFVAIALMLVLEPLLLHLFGTTPGKAVFGLKIEAGDGGRLSYGEGLARTWGVIGAGLGYNIPIYSLVRLWKSYRRCSENDVQPWDENISYVLKDEKGYRGVLYIGAWLSVVAVMVTVAFAQWIPPHRGELTVAEFADNYNYFTKFLGVDLNGAHLDESGQWIDSPYETTTIDLTFNEKPEYRFTVENGYVTGVSFTVDHSDNQDWINTYDTYMILASLSLVGAQDGTGLFSEIPGHIIRQIKDNTFADFDFTEAGIAFTCDTEYSGYFETADFLVPEDQAAQAFYLEFSINKFS